jgi:type I restriction enzyme, S subunit
LLTILIISSKVDEVIEAVENSIQVTDRLKKSLMQNLLTGKLKSDGTWRKKAEFKNGEKFILVPEEWEEVRVKDIGTIQTGKTPPTESDENFGDDYMFVTPGDLGDSMFITTTERFVSQTGIAYSYKIPKNSVMVVCIGSTIGKSGITTQQYCSNQQINSVICNESSDSFYFYYFMQHRRNHFKEYAGINATPQINKSDFSKYPVMRPKDIKVQKKIGSQIYQVDKVIHEKRAKIRTLNTLKKSLMQNLLTGKVRVDVDKVSKYLQKMRFGFRTRSS